MITRTKSIVHDRDQDQDRDPEPVAAKINPFSPPRKRLVAEPSSWTPFASSLPSGLSKPKQLLPFPLPLEPSTNTNTNTNIVDDTSDNPFLATHDTSDDNPFLIIHAPSSSQPDSAYTKALKQLRGEDFEMEDAEFLSGKKRRILSRSQSASTSTIWSRGGSAANALRPDSSRQQDKDKDKDKDVDMSDEVMGPTPRKKEDTFRPIFNSSPIKHKATMSRTNSPRKATTAARTNSLPPGMLLFAKKKADLDKLVETMEEGRTQLPTLLSSSSNAGTTLPPGKRKRSGGGTAPKFEDEDEDEDEGWSVAAAAAAAAGPIALLGLLPPSPPPVKESEQLQKQQQQQQQRLQWKGRSKSTTGKLKKKAKIVPSEGTSGEEYNAVEELAWKPVGPLKRRSQVANIDGAEPDLELELEDPIVVAHSKARLVVPVEEPEQEGDFEIDLPDQLKDILALTPSSKSSREDEETIVRNLLAGKREFLSKVEIWAAGEVPETPDDDGDDDWDGEPVGWWEAEL